MICVPDVEAVGHGLNERAGLNLVGCKTQEGDKGRNHFDDCTRWMQKSSRVLGLETMWWAMRGSNPQPSRCKRDFCRFKDPYLNM